MAQCWYQATHCPCSDCRSSDDDALNEPLLGDSVRAASVSLLPPGNVLTPEEVDIIHGAMDLRDLRVRDVTIPLSEVFMLSLDDVLDEDTMVRMMADGHR